MIKKNMKKHVNKLNYFLKIYPKYFQGIQKGKELITDFRVVTALNNKIKEVILLTKYDQFIKVAQLMDIIAIDKIDEMSNRFQLCYNLLNIERYERYVIRTVLPMRSFVISISSIFPSANWLERECWDLMGIPFLDHPDLRRILTNYGFEGHPLRKDFPAIGYVQVRYDDECKAVVEEPVGLSQEYRYFDFLSPWHHNDNINIK
jgi:NADH:ubiquinone oxidoreductase subunit C